MPSTTDTSAAASAVPGRLTAEIGVIGGSGFYGLSDSLTDVVVETPYGPTSDPLSVGEVAGRQVAFVARHGREHQWPPHRVPYRANLWALRSLGVRQVLAPCAVGSLRAELGPGALVVPDQLVDRTSGRPSTYFDGPVVHHAAFADPFCPRLRAHTVVAATADSWPVTDGGTMVVIEGPRFSSRAESQWYASAGWSLVNMTALPEAALARELGLCFASVALVTDRDAGVEEGSTESVTQAEVFRVFGENIERLRGLIGAVIARLPADEELACGCAADVPPVP
jgi:5'-methylthioadenosine phosphorylase